MYYKLKDFLEFNPKESIKRGEYCKKIAMEQLSPFCRDILGYEVAPYLGGSKFRNNDTIMARITPCLENGKRAKINILEKDEVAFGSTEYIVFRAKPNISDSNFIYYLVCSDLIREPAIKSMVGSSGRQRVQIDVLENLELNLPPLVTQQKIAKVLSALDDKIELNNQINKNLEEQAFSIFDNMFINIRDGIKIIKDYLLPRKGKNLLLKNAITGDVPVVAGGLNPATYHNVANTTAPVVTISASGANAGFVKLWHIPIWASDSSFIDESITGNVYFWFVMLKKRQKEIFDLQTGSAQPHIYPRNIEEMKIADIDVNSMEYFNIIVTPIFSQIGMNIEENLYLSQLRDTLLPKLMSGEIDVSKVDISSYNV